MTFHKKAEKNKRSIDALEAEKGLYILYYIFSVYLLLIK
jgi:hypothetical protein